uniref:Uncharacterized protein n=1 Tax=Octopus bimaculoides TaxID=37653 RepID=A0A0L8FUQ2_OCTBM
MVLSFIFFLHTHAHTHTHTRIGLPSMINDLTYPRQHRNDMGEADRQIFNYGCSFLLFDEHY